MSLKTQENDNDPVEFINSVENNKRREDALTLLPLFEKWTGKKPRMWGDSIIGFGKYRYTYKSGRSGEWPVTGFSPRKQNLTIYIMSGFENEKELLSQLGKHKLGKSCLYINKLEDVDLNILEKIVKANVKWMEERYEVVG